MTKYGAGNLFIKVSKTFPSSFSCLSKRTLKIDSSLLNIKTLIQSMLASPERTSYFDQFYAYFINICSCTATVTLAIDEDRKVCCIDIIAATRTIDRTLSKSVENESKHRRVQLRHFYVKEEHYTP